MIKTSKNIKIIKTYKSIAIPNAYFIQNGFFCQDVHLIDASDHDISGKFELWYFSYFLKIGKNRGLLRYRGLSSVRIIVRMLKLVLCCHSNIFFLSSKHILQVLCSFINIFSKSIYCPLHFPYFPKMGIFPLGLNAGKKSPAKTT